MGSPQMHSTSRTAEMSADNCMCTGGTNEAKKKTKKQNKTKRGMTIKQNQQL